MQSGNDVKYQELWDREKDADAANGTICRAADVLIRLAANDLGIGELPTKIVAECLSIATRMEKISDELTRIGEELEAAREALLNDQ